MPIELDLFFKTSNWEYFRGTTEQKRTPDEIYTYLHSENDPNKLAEYYKTISLEDLIASLTRLGFTISYEEAIKAANTYSPHVERINQDFHQSEVMKRSYNLLKTLDYCAFGASPEGFASAAAAMSNSRSARAGIEDLYRRIEALQRDPEASRSNNNETQGRTAGLLATATILGFALSKASAAKALFVFTAVGGSTVVGLGIVYFCYNYRYIPSPRYISPFENYSELVHLVKFQPLIGRKEVISKIIRCWENQQFPLLVGDLENWNKEIMKEIACNCWATEGIWKDIARFTRIYEDNNPRLRRKQMIAGSISGLIPQGPAPEKAQNIFRNLLSEVASIKDQVIFAFTQFHRLFKHQELLQSFLDRRLDLPLMICSTTTGKYKRHIESKPIEKTRFQILFIEELKKHELIEMLSQYVKVEDPNFPIDEHLLETIYNQSERLRPQFSNYTQFEIARALLEKVLNKINIKPIPKDEELLEKEKSKLAGLKGSIDLLDPERAEKQFNLIKECNSRVDNLVKTVQRQKGKIDEFNKVLKMLREVNPKLANLARTITQCEDEESKKFYIKEFIFLYYYLRPKLQAKLKTLLKDNEIQIPVLNEEVIKRIADEMEQDAKKLPREKEVNNNAIEVKD